MKVIRYYGPNQHLVLEEVKRPELGPGELLVRVRACGICHTELHFLSGLLNLGVAPVTLGHEVVGTVEEVGTDVRNYKLGERVIIYYYVGCSKCIFCQRGEENLCEKPQAQYGFISDGGFAEYIKIPARNAVPVPPRISDVNAAPIGCSVTTAIHAGGLVKVKSGEFVLVYGIGSVGYSLIQYSKLVGANVIGVGRNDRKLELAKQLGADFVINAGQENVEKRIRDITDGRGIDVIFELVATRETMENSVKSLAKRGRLVFIGYSEDALNIHPLQLVVGEINILGSVGNTLDELYQAVRLVSEGKIKTIVDRTLPLERFQEGIKSLAAGEAVGRVVLTV